MKTPNSAPSMAASKSASAKKIFGDFPPSSRVTRLMESAAVRRMILPTAALPVKAILSTSGCATSGAPADSPKPVTMLTTPGGKPISSNQPAISKTVSGVCSAGFSTQVQPAAKAGASFHAAMSKRIIPGNDLPGNSHRLTQGKTQRIVGNRVDVAEDFGGKAAVIFEASGGIVDIEFRFDDRLATVARFELGQSADSFRMRSESLKSKTSAILRGHLRPWAGIESGTRGLSGAIDIRCIGVRNLGDDLFGRRIVNREPGSARCFDPLAIDVHSTAIHMLTCTRPF